MLEDSDNGKNEILPKERERIPLALAKEKEQEKIEKMVRNHQDEKTHRCANGHSNRVKDSQILLEREMM